MSAPVPQIGENFTKVQSDNFLATDLAPVEHVLNTAVVAPMTQNQFDAMASLGFNIGAGGLRTSTVIRRLNAGDVQGAAHAFMLWDHPAELTGRRAAEQKQFLTPDAVVPAATASQKPAVPQPAAAGAAAKPTGLFGRLAYFFGRH